MEWIVDNLDGLDARSVLEFDWLTGRFVDVCFPNPNRIEDGRTLYRSKGYMFAVQVGSIFQSDKELCLQINIRVIFSRESHCDESTMTEPKSRMNFILSSIHSFICFYRLSIGVVKCLLSTRLYQKIRNDPMEDLAIEKAIHAKL